MKDLTTTVLYTCNMCGLVKIPVKVKAREKEEDLEKWMLQMGAELSENHNRRSPNCKPKTFTNIMIPYDGTDYVGGPKIN